jgi:hypothetical protein
MKRLICWFRGHRWGSWFNKKTGQYHSICCERCGMWYGDAADGTLSSTKPAHGVVVGLPPSTAPEEGYPDQTVMETSAERGNCLQATLAAILGRPLESVPHFVSVYPQGDDWWDRMAGWLYDEGYLLRYPPIEPVLGEPLPLCGLGGWSTRGFPHIVVGDTATGQMLHDPHPSRAGLVKTDYTLLIYRRAPAPGVAVPHGSKHG